MNQSISRWVRTRSGRVHRAFTLVELLVVIAIIGLLVGLTVPAVLSVRAAFEKGALKFEVQALNDAIENYRSKNGDYPPDCSNWAFTERHMRKAYPEILGTELALLNPTNVRIDPAEALVLFLGGFSTDKQRPLSGKGGPFINIGTATAPDYRYNGSRENSFYEFPSDRLTLFNSPTGIISNDESNFMGGTDDLFPVFMSRGNSVQTGAPYVYFDSRTYKNAYYQPSIATSPTAPRGVLGSVRPHLASVSATGSFAFLNDKTFQVISPGADGRYGGRLVAIGAQWFTLNGLSFVTNGTTMGPDAASSGKFELSENAGIVVRPSYDNASNFTELKTLGDGAL